MLLLPYCKPDKSQKPFAPQETYSEGVLEETIIDWSWIDESELFREGWWPVRIINMDHPVTKKSFEDVIELQEIAWKRKFIPHEALELRITI